MLAGQVVFLMERPLQPKSPALVAHAGRWCGPGWRREHRGRERAGGDGPSLPAGAWPAGDALQVRLARQHGPSSTALHVSRRCRAAVCMPWHACECRHHGRWLRPVPTDGTKSRSTPLILRIPGRQAGTARPSVWTGSASRTRRCSRGGCRQALRGRPVWGKTARHGSASHHALACHFSALAPAAPP